MLLRNLPCSSPRGSRSSPPIFGPVFSWNRMKRPTSGPSSFDLTSAFIKWSVSQMDFYLQHAIALPFKQTTIAETDERHLLQHECYFNRKDHRWENRMISESYSQCLWGSLSRAMALCPQAHLKKRLTASCHRSWWFCSTQRSAGLK